MSADENLLDGDFAGCRERPNGVPHSCGDLDGSVHPGLANLFRSASPNPGIGTSADNRRGGKERELRDVGHRKRPPSVGVLLMGPL